MKTLIVSRPEVAELLPMDECIDVMAEAVSLLAGGEALNPLRQGIWLPDKSGILGMMPAYLAGGSLGVKIVSVFPGNQQHACDVHQGAVLLFETQRGRLTAIVDASEITAIRTAAVSGLATRTLARDDAKTLAILGSGVQAGTHLAAMLLVRDFESIRVWSRNWQRAQEFAQRHSQRQGIQVEAVHTAAEAVTGADVICTTTSASQPILQGEWLAAGAHINAIGSSVRFTREVDTAGVVRASLFVDRRESTLNEAGEFLIAKQEGAIDDDHIRAELGEVLTRRQPGRTSADEITLFKGLGLGIYDVAAADHVFQKATQRDLGTWVELGP